jgi:hypothetical protein
MDLMLLRNARATFFTRRAKVLGSLAVIATLCGCEMSRQDHLIEARAALADAAYDDAVAAAEAGLRAAAAGSQEVLDDATSWGLELAKLEAHARAGHGEEAKAQLARLAELHPNRVEASEYFATAHQLRGAGAGTAAIEVLDRGAILFPYEPVIGRMIEVSGESGDPAELELLRSLGYVE